MNSAQSPCIEFIRHGLPEGGNRYRGNGVDDPLSETGWQQMWNAMGQDTQWGLIVSSPMRRCRAFAEAFAETHGIRCVIEEGFTEVAFGSWEGKTKQQLRQEDKAFFEAFYVDAVSNRPTGAECLQDFQQRVFVAFNDLISTYPKQRILVVGHAGIMRMMMAKALGIPLQNIYRVNIEYAARMCFQAGDPLRVRLH